MVQYILWRVLIEQADKLFWRKTEVKLLRQPRVTTFSSFVSWLPVLLNYQHFGKLKCYQSLESTSQHHVRSPTVLTKGSRKTWRLFFDHFVVARHAIILLRSDIPSGMCGRLRTVAASNNRDHAELWAGPGLDLRLSRCFGPRANNKMFSQRRKLLSPVTVEAIELIKSSLKMINCELFSHIHIATSPVFRSCAYLVSLGKFDFRA